MTTYTPQTIRTFFGPRLRKAVNVETQKIQSVFTSVDTDKLSIVQFLPGQVRPKTYMKMDYKTPTYEVAPDRLEAPSNSTLNFSKQSSEDNGITFTKYQNTNNIHILVSMEAENSAYTADEYVSRMILSKMMMKGAFINSSSCIVSWFFIVF